MLQASASRPKEVLAYVESERGRAHPQISRSGSRQTVLEPEGRLRPNWAEVANGRDNRGLRRGNEGRSDHSRHAGAARPLKRFVLGSGRPGRIAGGPVAMCYMWVAAAAASGLTGIQTPGPPSGA